MCPSRAGALPVTIPVVHYDKVDSERTARGGVLFRLRRGDELVATLEIDLQPRPGDAPEVTEVRLSAAHGITPTTLKRFAWDQWITKAKALAASPGIFLPAGDDPLQRRQHWLDDWSKYETTLRSNIGHPGRGGHPDEHYTAVLNAYQALEAAGDPSPIRTISARLEISRNTVASWLKRAREKQPGPKP